jgi:hypothetical protein
MADNGNRFDPDFSPRAFLLGQLAVLQLSGAVESLAELRAIVAELAADDDLWASYDRSMAVLREHMPGIKTEIEIGTASDHAWQPRKVSS